jgi:hypothetical protein
MYESGGLHAAVGWNGWIPKIDRPASRARERGREEREKERDRDKGIWWDPKWIDQCQGPVQLLRGRETNGFGGIPNGLTSVKGQSNC